MTFDELVADYYPMLSRFLLGQTHHQQEAQDLTQETFLRALRAWPQFEGYFPKRWLFQIAVNLLRDRWRQQQALHFVSLSQPVLDQAEDEQTPFVIEDSLADDDPWSLPDAVAIRREAATAVATQVHDVLATLPAERAQFFLDYYGTGHPVRNTATQHGKSYSAAKSLTFRIRQEMRAALVRQAAG